ncbi:MAG TPA: xanthine dehydrogenase family protein subunit M [Bryobacteraceae bacterium]|nr:xanthine dehydrogenase family protein subunit M [Bryobacteraceae bacterium]
MQAFEYANPTTLQEATGLLGTKWGEADVLAGGTDLISLMKDGVYATKRVVNIKNIKELGGIRKAGSGVRIGATVTLDELLENSTIRSQFPALADAARGIRSPQIRNMGTVGGDLCQRPRCWYYRGGNGLLAQDSSGRSLVENGENRYHAIFGGGPAYFVSASSLGPALIAMNAKVTLVGRSGKRELPVEQFFVTPRSNEDREIALQPGEILTEIVIPAAAPRSATYEVREREALDWPLVAAAVVLGPKGRVVLGHVAPTPYVAAKAEQMIAGKTMNDAVAEQIGAAAVADAKPLSQNAYKVQLAKVAVKRALMEAAGRKA